MNVHGLLQVRQDKRNVTTLMDSVKSLRSLNISGIDLKRQNSATEKCHVPGTAINQPETTGFYHEGAQFLWVSTQREKL